jgi:hypothetical protein
MIQLCDTNTVRSLAKNLLGKYGLAIDSIQLSPNGMNQLRKQSQKNPQENSSAGPKNRPAQLSQGWLSELRQIALSDHFRISIFWVAWLAYASDSNRCNIPAWSHRA